jgi:hypothetical protein
MTEHRRAVDATTTTKAAGPIDRLGHVLKQEGEMPVIPDVRLTDLEPYVGLRYLSKLFKLMGIVLLLLLVAEIITGVVAQGSAEIPTLLGEASRLIVLAGVLWGVGDLAVLLVDVGHDVRAARILLARQTHAGTSNNANTTPVATPRVTEPANGVARP